MRRVIRRVFAGFVLGFIFTLLRGLPFFFAVHIPPSVRHVCQVLNFPALWLARAWSQAGLPSFGELGRELILPSGAIIGQWVAIAILVGYFWRGTTRKGSYKKEEHAAATK